jgi:hypothetical protein
VKFPREELRRIVVEVSGLHDKTVTWWNQPEAFPGPRTSYPTATIVMQPLIEMPEGDDEFREIYNETTDFIDVSHVSRRVTTLQFSCTVYKTNIYAEDILATVRKRMRRPEVLVLLREAGLALVSKGPVRSMAFQSDERVLSRALLELKVRSLIDDDDGFPITWIETADVSEDV